MALPLIFLSLLLSAAPCSAQEENETSYNESMTLWWNESESDGLEESEFVDDYYDFYSYYEEPTAGEPISLAIPISDLNGDSASDILVMEIASDTNTNAFSTGISVMGGSDGSMLWQKEYPGGLAIPYPAKDLNGDGLSDVVINLIIAGTDFIPYSEMTAHQGYDGALIWSRPHLLAATFAYPVNDSTGDNATDLVEHIFGIDSLNGSLVTKISLVDGSDGAEITSNVFPGAVAVEYPAGNFTSDAISDSITAVYKMDGINGENVTTIIAAKSGIDHGELWNISLEDSVAIAVPVQDITGDGTDDLVAYMISNNTTVTFEMAVIRGTDGQMLWRRSSGESVAIAFVGPDLTGEGTKDLIVYNMDESGEGETEAVKGDDGSILWAKPMMIFLPQ